MARPGPVPRVVVAGFVAVAGIVAGFVGSPVRAEDAGNETIIVPGRTMSALTVDLDDDGSREIVRLSDDIGPDLTLETWVEAPKADGGWTSGPSVTVPDPTEGDSSIAHYVVAAALIEARGRDGPRLILVANGTDLNSQLAPHSCCLELHEVVLDADRLRLLPLEAPFLGADDILAVDMDGDGIDELVTSSSAMSPEDEMPTATITVMRWNGSGYGVYGRADLAGWGVTALSATVGDTDGRPGADLVLLGGEGHTLVRLRSALGRLASESEQIPIDGIDSGSAWFNGVVGGRILLSVGDIPFAFRWPADGRLERDEAAELEPSSVPLGVVGAEDRAIVVAGPMFGELGPTNDLEVYDATLSRLGTVEAGSPSVRALSALLEEASRTGGWTLQRSPWPYSGPFPAADAGEPGWTVGGTVIEPDDSNGYRVTEMPPTLGVPVGRAGADDAWLAICDGCWSARNRGWLAAEAAYATGQLTLTRWDAFTAGNQPEATVRHVGALAVGEDPDTATTELVAAPEGFELVIESTPGTAVISWDGVRLVDHGFLTEPVRLRIDPPNLDREDLEEEAIADASRFERTLIVIGPDGRFSVRGWTGTFAGDDPSLDARPILSSDLTAQVRGRTDPYATVTVDGRRVELGEDGAFRATVDAPPWPRTVVVEATDPFGGAAQTTVEVIGLVDYRGLPWALIIATIVAAFGAALFVRVPRLRRSPAAPVGDGAFEELDDGHIATLDRGAD